MIPEAPKPDISDQDRVITEIEQGVEPEDHFSATAFPLLEVPENATRMKSDDDHLSSAQEY